MTVHNKEYVTPLNSFINLFSSVCIRVCPPAVRNVGVLLFEHIVMLSPRAASVSALTAAAAPMMAKPAAEPVGSAGRRIHDMERRPHVLRVKLHSNHAEHGLFCKGTTIYVNTIMNHDDHKPSLLVLTVVKVVEFFRQVGKVPVPQCLLGS